MKTIYSDDHRLQDGTAELINGKMVPCHERPERADMILARVREAGLGDILEPTEHGMSPLRRAHADNYLTFLETAWDAWVEKHGEYDGLPTSWPINGLRRDREPEHIDGKMGFFSFDAGSPITSGTWRAVRASADVALTGQAMVTGCERAVFSLCRPPGHHAGRDFCGGYCFLNNAAIAAEGFRDAGAERLAILDIDYHHGNGTQAIFYDRDDVFFASLHGHPLQEYPYYLGFEDETGDGPGDGCNANYPMRHGTGFDVWGAALDSACDRIARFGADALVISLGVDTFEDDPISEFKLASDDYLRVGARIAALNLPTLFVMEGGYAVEAIGVNAVNVLTGFENA